MTNIRVADRYALDREIGRGGSGAVWLARDEVLGRVVAMKRVGLPPGASAFEMARAEREARLAARVNHPNVISVFDFVNEGDHHWLVTEYVDGTTLATMIRERGRLSAEEAAPLLLQVAEALAEAHRTGVVHRDVKPSNILIARDGTVKLSDFGIARAESDASLTQTGLVTGSPAYLAPEVATGASATAASDVWSFGTTIYHALSGRPPYEVTGEGSAVLATLYKIAHEDPPRLRNAGWLGPLLEAAMDRDPLRRPTMDDVVSYLRARPPAPPVIGTQVLPAAEPAEPEPDRTDHTLVGTAAAPVGGVAAPAGPSNRSVGFRTALAGLAVLAVLAVVGVILVIGADDEDPTDAASPDGGAGSPSSATTQTEDSASPTRPTEAELEEFASSYVTTAASDPDAGFALLTPAYQARSTEYADFWGPVSNPEVLDVSADADAMTVTYTYQYDFPGSGNRTEQVTLFLVQEGDELLIDDAVSQVVQGG
ncbi:serine/threonine-protein kinase [Nocardioides antri]|nr:serine/threonine-protein kinase [Nocardioides antri]